MHFLIVIFGILFGMPLMASQKEPILIEAMIARVGREAILVSDLMRFKEVENVMRCAGLRETVVEINNNEASSAVLNRFIEEELIYQELRSKQSVGVSHIRDAIQAIQAKKNCLKDWQALGKRFEVLWGTAARPMEGEAQLVRELEKRLAIQIFEKEQIQGDRSIWIRSARIKTPIKLFLD